MEAKNLVKLLVFVALACFQSVCDCMDLQGMHTQIVDANSELNEFLASQNPRTVETYLEVARRELNRLNSEQAPMDAKLNVLTEFVNLGNLLGNIKCDLDEYKLIRWADFEGHLYVPESELETMAPTDLVAHQVGLERAEKCKDVWPVKYMEAYRDYPDKEVLKLAQFKAESLSKKRREFANNDRGYIEYLMNYEAPSDPERTEDACMHLIRHSANDPWRANFDLMYDRYLLVPCETFGQHLDEPYLQQARYDAQMFRDQDTEIFDQNKSEYIPFYEGLVQAEACFFIGVDTSKQQVRDCWFEKIGYNGHS